MTRVGSRRLRVIIGGVVVGTVALALPGFHWMFTLVALSAVALLALVAPHVVVAGVVVSIPVQSEIMLPFVRGELSVTQLMLFGLIAGWGVIFWHRRVWLDSVVVGFLLLLSAYAVSFIAVDSPSLWFQETYRWAVAGVFYVICRSVITSWQQTRLVIWAVALGVAGVCLLSGWQLVNGDATDPTSAGRVAGSFGTPNTLAAYLEMTVPLLLACIPIVWWAEGEWRATTLEKWVVILVPLGGLGLLGLTQSRGGWVGMMAACVVLWLHLPRRARLPTAGIAIIVLAGFLVTAPGQSQLRRFTELREESTTEQQQTSARASYDTGARRGALWTAAQAMMIDFPLTGVGAGQFDENYRDYVPSWSDRAPRGQAHNVWLQMGAQAGIWGIVGYASWFAASLWAAVTARRRLHDAQRYWLLTGVLAVYIAYAVHSMVDYLNVLSLGLQLSVITAIALNMAPNPLSRYANTRVPAHVTSQPEIAQCPQ